VLKKTGQRKTTVNKVNNRRMKHFLKTEHKIQSTWNEIQNNNEEQTPQHSQNRAWKPKQKIEKHSNVTNNQQNTWSEQTTH